jgi:hypothetical protein
MSIEVMKQALEALECQDQLGWSGTIAALRQAITEAALQNITDFDVQSTHSADCYKWHHACAVARIERAEKQAEQAQPVAWIRNDKKLALNDGGFFSSNWTPLYTAPPQRKPLTDEELHGIWSSGPEMMKFARAIEAAHGIKGEA